MGGRGVLSGERGSAVVDFVMVSMLIVALLLAVLQVAVYVHVRNVVTASAQAGARFAANADVDSAAGAGRTVEVAGRATSEQTARVRGADPERGDVPGWVMITVMTAALVLAILIPFREAIVSAVQNALASVTSGG